jgi:hypothetical protein
VGVELCVVVAAGVFVRVAVIVAPSGVVTARRVAVGATVAGGGEGVSVGSFDSLVGGTDVSAGLGVRVGTVEDASALSSCAQAVGPAAFAAAIKANTINKPKIIQRRIVLLLLTCF